MDLNQLLDAKTVKNYQQYLKSVGMPAATIDRKLSSLKKWQEFVKTNYLKKISGQTDQSGSNDILFPASSLRSSAQAHSDNPLTNLYRRYSQSRIGSYLNLAILMVFAAAMAVFGYNQIFKEALISQAFPQAPDPTTPNRILSFQARLTDSSDTPITTATDMRFILYNDEAASGAAKLWEELRYIDPDQDGLFSVQLGTETAIPSSLFTENSDLYLGVTVETDPEATPRQRIASVGYALNAETLQGFPPSASASADQIPVLTQEGDLVLAAASPQVYSSSGTFGIKGQILSVTTDTGTNGAITIAPDGTGSLLLSGSTTTQNFIRATNANLSSGHLISGYVGNDTATGDLLNLSSGAVEAEVFTVGRTGDTFIAGSLTATGTLDANGTVTLGDGGDAVTIDGSSLALQTTGAGSDITLNAVDDIILTDFTSCTALETDDSGILTCGSDGGESGGGMWQENAGAISPINNTWDVLIGATASTSAKFAFINIDSGTPTASIAGQIALSGGNRNIQTTAQNSLILGGDTTGDILIQPNGDTGDYFRFLSDNTNLTLATTDGSNLTITPAGTLNLNSTGDMTLDSSTDIVLDADGADLIFKDAGTTIATFTNSATDLNLDIAGGDLTLVSGDNLNLTDASDLIFGGTTSLAETTAANDSGAFLVGTFDEFANSASANVQDVLDDLDAAITTVNSTNFWSQSLGSLYPNNSSVDLLIGGQASTSAKFAVLNMNSGTPTASISGSSAGFGAYLTGDGTLSTTLNRSLALNPGGGNVGIGDSSPLALFTVGSGDLFQINSSGIIAKIDNVAHTIDDVSGDLTLTSNSTSVLVADDLGVNGATSADITSTTATATVFNSTVTSLSLGDAATTLNIGTGTTANTINIGTGDTNADDINIGGLSTSHTDFTGIINVAGGTTYYIDASGNVNFNAGTFAGTLTANGTLDTNGQIDLGDGGDAITLNGNAVTIQTTGAGTDITLDAVDDIILTDFLSCTALETDGSGILACGSDGGGGSAGMWQENAGAISPINNTWDVLIGGTASTSAKFAFINVDSGTPTASIAGQITLAGGNRNIQTAASTDLILGGDTTGDILFQPNGDTGDYLKLTSDGTNLTLATTDGANFTLTPAGTLSLNSTGDMTLDSSTDIILDADGADVILKDTTTEFARFTNSSTDLIIDAAGGGVLIGTGTPLVLDMAGDDLLVTDDLEILGGVATMSAATNTFTGKALNIQSTEFSTLNLGGSTTGNILINPGSNHYTEIRNNSGGEAAFHIDQLGTGDVLTASVSGTTVFRIDTTGYAHYQRYADLASDAYFLDPAAAGTSLNIEGSIVSNGAFSISSNGDNNITINAGAGEVIIGDGTGKLDAGLVDPPYTINGQKYATYMAAMTGVKEETTGTVTTQDYVAGVGYRYTIDFASQAEGSDLWLFSKVTNLKQNLPDMVVLLSPAGSTRAWYTLDTVNNRLNIFSSLPTAISYRLTAPRFDADSWANTRDSNSTGYVINDDNNWQTYASGTLVGGNIFAEVFEAIEAGVANISQLVVDSLTITDKLISPVIETKILVANEVTVKGNASISGELTAGSIKSSTIDSLRDRLADLAESYREQTATVAAQEIDPTFQAWLDALESNPATSSAEYLAVNSIEAQAGFFSEYLGVMGQANITDLTVTNTLDVTTLTSGTGAINFLAGLVTMDVSGQVTINGDLMVTGTIVAQSVEAPHARFDDLLAQNITSTGSASFDSVASRQATFDSLIIASDASASADTASASASITTNATAGKSLLPAGATEYTIYTPHISADTLTYVTPIGDSQNQVLYVKAKQDNEWFKVAINQPLPYDLEFNWWTIKLE